MKEPHTIPFIGRGNTETTIEEKGVLTIFSILDTVCRLDDLSPVILQKIL